jgi:hypothetical protein
LRVKLLRPIIREGVVTDTKARRAFAASIVQRWWNDKISSGLVSVQAHAWRHGVEYVGNLPWPDRVSMMALYEDFCYCKSQEIIMSREAFYFYLRKVLGNEAKTQKSVKHKIGTVNLKSTRLTFVGLPRK